MLYFASELGDLRQSRRKSLQGSQISKKNDMQHLNDMMPREHMKKRKRVRLIFPINCPVDSERSGSRLRRQHRSSRGRQGEIENGHLRNFHGLCGDIQRTYLDWERSHILQNRVSQK